MFWIRVCALSSRGLILRIPQNGPYYIMRLSENSVHRVQEFCSVRVFLFLWVTSSRPWSAWLSSDHRYVMRIAPMISDRLLEVIVSIGRLINKIIYIFVYIDSKLFSAFWNCLDYRAPSARQFLSVIQKSAKCVNTSVAPSLEGYTRIEDEDSAATGIGSWDFWCDRLSIWSVPVPIWFISILLRPKSITR